MHALCAEGMSFEQRAELERLLAEPLEEDTEQKARIDQWKASFGFR